MIESPGKFNGWIEFSLGQGERFIRKYFFGVTLLLLASTGAVAQETKSVTTRFGDLTVSDAGVLLFKGSPVQPTVEVNNSLDLSEPYKIGTSDVVLVTNNGGTGCPADFYFVTVTKSGAEVTPRFGTCSDLIKVKRVGDSISVSMPGFLGSSMSKRAQSRAARERHVYISTARAWSLRMASPLSNIPMDDSGGGGRNRHSPSKVIIWVAFRARRGIGCDQLVTRIPTKRH